MDHSEMRKAVIPPVPPPPSFEEGIGSEDTSNSPLQSYFVPFILMLDPLEFYVVGVVIAIIISLELRPTEQDAVGTFIELIGFSLSTIATQGLYLETIASAQEQEIQAKEHKQLIKEVEELKKTVAELKALLSNKS